MPDLTNFFLGGKSNEVLVETYEISHPSFSKVYRLVKNVTGGVTVTLEDDTEADFEYYPLKTSRMQTTETLDSSINISLGDQGEIIGEEIDRVRAAGGMKTKPKVIYRGYSSTDYTTIIDGPFTFEIEGVTRKHEGAAFEAKPPELNRLRTGEFYRFERFKMLKGML